MLKQTLVTIKTVREKFAVNFLEHPILHVENWTDMLLQIVIISMSFVTKWTLNWVIPVLKKMEVFREN